MSLEKLNSRYAPFITIQEKGNKAGPLSGLTFGIKDIIETAGIRTTAGSRILSNYVPKNDAWVVKRVLELGGTILGKTNTHEFAVGATNTSSIAGPARNPRDPERISGGSSGGSAVAVGLGIVDVGVGTDTGGSVRIPASLCGVIGYKPTTGILPKSGVIPFSWTLDTIGFLTRDFEVLWRVVVNVTPVETRKVFMSKGGTKIRAGLFMFGEDEVSVKLRDRVEEFGLDIVKVSLPNLEKEGGKVRRTIAVSEGASYHMDWLNSRAQEYFPDVREVLSSGLSVTAVDYINSLRKRRLLLEEYVGVFKGVDVVLSPTTKMVAPKIHDVLGKEKEFRDKLVGITELFNLVGAPSISIPFLELEGLPVGLMVSGPPYRDGTVLDVAKYLISSN